MKIQKFNLMKNIGNAFLIILISFQITIAQDDEYVDDNAPLLYEDHIYQDNIKTVQMRIAGMNNVNPIVLPLNSGIMELSFDELTDEVQDYAYKIILCNADWTPNTDLTDMEYLDGFTGERITNYDFSFNTTENFVHYKLTLPNNDIKWTKSGNYLLLIYDEEDEERLILSRRFMVVDQSMQVRSKVQRPMNFNTAKTHQEIDFVINHKGINVSNPQLEVKTVILQNGRWDNAIKDLKPLFIKPNELVYDYQNKIVFPAGKEYRYVNLTSFRYKTDRVAQLIDDDVDGNIVQLMTERSRAFLPYLFEQDLNGTFIINNEHREDNDLEADYGQIHFAIEKPLEIEGGDVYIFGALSDWKINERFRMTYNETRRVYQAKIQLKQGFYNFKYAFVKHGSKTVDFSELEGNWHETENNYTILVYYRPFGSRYDQLVAVQTLNSLQ